MRIIRSLFSIALVVILFGLTLVAFTALPNDVDESLLPPVISDTDSEDDDNNETSVDSTVSILMRQILELNEKLHIVTTERASIVDELLQSQLSNESKERIIRELEDNIFNLNIYIAELNQMIVDLTVENTSLKSYIVVLEEIRASLLQSIYALEQQIQLLHSDILNTRFVCTFMFDDNIYSVVLVPIQGRVEVESPISTEYTIFLGWSLSQDGDLIDLESFVPTQDTVFYAKIIRKYNVSFVYDDELYCDCLYACGKGHSYIVEKSYTKTVISPSSTDRKIFLGWSLNGVDIINPAEHQIWEHTTYFAVVQIRHYITFAYNRNNTVTTLSTQYQATANNINVPSAPLISGYIFDGWTLNGQSISNPKTIILNGDVVFFARYVSYNQSVSNLPLPVSSMNGGATGVNISGQRIEAGSGTNGARPVIIDRVFINLDNLMDLSSPLGSLSCDVEIVIGSVTYTQTVTIASVIDTQYKARSLGQDSAYSSEYTKWYGVYHKSKEPFEYKEYATTSGAYLGTHVIIFDIYVINTRWYEINNTPYLELPDPATIRIKSVSYRFVDSFSY